MAENEPTIEEAREVARAASEQLAAAIARECPNHMPVQHRDGKPAWCPHCGRTGTGQMIKEGGH